MVENFTTKGIWWIPSKPNKKLPGILSYDPFFGAKLEIIGGSFEEINELQNIKRFEIICGFAGAAKFTLRDCITESFSIQSPGTLTITYLANIVFKGFTFEKPSDIMFNKVKLDYNYLLSWANQSNLEKIFIDNENSIEENFEGIKRIKSSPIEIMIASEKLKISLVSPVSIKANLKRGDEITLKTETYLEIEPTEKTSFEEFIKIAEKLQRFLTLAIDRPIQIIKFRGEIKNEKDKVIEEAEVFLPLQKDLLKDDDFVHPSFMPFSLEMISDRFSIILNKWFEKYELLNPIYDLYFAIRFNPAMYIELKFLNFIICIESYHRRIYDGTYLPDQEFQEFVDLVKKAITDSNDEDYHDFIQDFIQSLEYENELSLRKRLKLLINKHDDIYCRFIKNKGEFISSVVSTRNYRIHLDERLKKYAVKNSEELFEMNLKLNLLLDVCIYSELDFGNKEIKKILDQRYEYRTIN